MTVKSFNGSEVELEQPHGVFRSSCLFPQKKQNPSESLWKTNKNSENAHVFGFLQFLHGFVVLELYTWVCFWDLGFYFLVIVSFSFVFL